MTTIKHQRDVQQTPAEVIDEDTSLEKVLAGAVDAVTSTPGLRSTACMEDLELSDLADQLDRFAGEPTRRLVEFRGPPSTTSPAMQVHDAQNQTLSTTEQVLLALNSPLPDTPDGILPILHGDRAIMEHGEAEVVGLALRLMSIPRPNVRAMLETFESVGRGGPSMASVSFLAMNMYRADIALVLGRDPWIRGMVAGTPGTSVRDLAAALEGGSRLTHRARIDAYFNARGRLEMAKNAFETIDAIRSAGTAPTEPVEVDAMDFKGAVDTIAAFVDDHRLELKDHRLTLAVTTGDAATVPAVEKALEIIVGPNQTELSVDVGSFAARFVDVLLPSQIRPAI